MTINKVCGSGLKAAQLAAQAIKAGDADIVIAGGQENMSAAPYVLPKSRDGFRMGDTKLVDCMIIDGLWDVYNKDHMGTPPRTSRRSSAIARAEQDAFAAASQQRAEAAQERAGSRRDRPVEIPSRRATAIVFDSRRVSEARHNRRSWRAQAGLREGGTVTAGNASGINDGAAAVVVMSARRLRGWA